MSSDQFTLFQEAVASGDRGTVDLLLKYGPLAAVASKTKRLGRSCLLLACALGDAEMVQVMLKYTDEYLMKQTGMPKHANIIYLNTDRDYSSNSALHELMSCTTAKSDGVLKSLIILLEAGLRADLVNKSGLTALHVLCRNPVLSRTTQGEIMAELLISRGAPINLADPDGVSALLLAAVCRSWGMCRVLLQHGADLNIPAASTAESLSDHSLRRLPSAPASSSSASSSSPTRSPLRVKNDGLSLSPVPRMCRRLSAATNSTAGAAEGEEDKEAPPPPAPATLSPRSPPSKGTRARGDSMVALLDAMRAYPITAADMIPRSLRGDLFCFLDRTAQSLVDVTSVDRCQECAKQLSSAAAVAPPPSPLAPRTRAAPSPADPLSCFHCRRVVCSQCCRFDYPATLASKALAASSASSASAVGPGRGRGLVVDENASKSNGKGKDKCCTVCVRAVLKIASDAKLKG